MGTSVDLLIIGAGPFGLAMAAWARQAGIDYLVVGEPMAFWRGHMPSGMILRSASDWHLDPGNDDTIERFLAQRGLTAAESEPLPLALYLDYAAWFQTQQRIAPLSVMVTRLAPRDDGQAGFTATLADGQTITVRRVVLAIGLQHYAFVPAELAALVPADQASHTCDAVDFGRAAGKRFLIVGGRQSAFEWTALMCEYGAAEIHLCYRHDTPEFRPSDWTWTTPLLDGLIANPSWYRTLPAHEREAVSYRMWGEGRLKLEPWLGPRIDRPGISLWPHRQITACTATSSGVLQVGLDNDETLEVDQVIFATGYKVDLSRVPLLTDSGLLERIEQRNGYPVLDDHLQSSLPGLYITGLPASQDFGPFWGFTAAVRTSAQLIGQGLTSRVAHA